MENQVTTSTNKNSYTCHICQEIGSSDHPTRSCPSLTCHECGRSGHAKKHCPKLLVCTKCAQKGHEKKNCPRSKICGKCGQDGHLSIDCKISEDSDDEIEVIIPPPKPAPVVVDLPDDDESEEEEGEIKTENEAASNSSPKFVNSFKPVSSTSNGITKGGSSKIFCDKCFQNDHVTKNCPKARLEELLKNKHRGIVKKFNKITYHCVLQDKEGSMWTFFADRAFDINDDVAYDLGENTNKPKNVVKIKDLLVQQSSSTRNNKRPNSGNEPAAADVSGPKIPKPKLKFKSVCVLDLHMVKLSNGLEYITQIGGVLMDGKIVEYFLRPVKPEYPLSISQLKTMNLSSISDEYKYGYVLKRARKSDVLCCSEKEALEQFLEKLEFLDQLSLYTTDLDIMMKILMAKFKKYNLVERFARNVPWLCDLKSIVKSKNDLKHLKSFCWTNFNLVYEHVMGEMMPDSGDNLTAEQTAQLLWLTTDQILNSELMESDDFANYMSPSKILLNTQGPILSSEGLNGMNFQNGITYSSSVFQKTLL